MVIHPDESPKAVAVFQSFDEVFVTSAGLVAKSQARTLV
jgi:hypothetical protein